MIRLISHRAKKSLGQNFLVDKNIRTKIINAADLKKSDSVLEVGPGQGFLTEELAKLSNKIVAVEKDKKLFYLLEYKYPGVKMVHDDILRLDFAELKKLLNNKPYKVVANLPYNITSKFLRRFLESDYAPEQMIVMVQREVAERLTAKPPEMSLLAVAVQFYSKPKILFKVSNTCFVPKPKIESAVISLENIKPQFKADPARFFQVTKLGFSQKRKQLKNVLSKFTNISEALVEIGLSPSIRAQELTVNDWVNLVNKLN